jgi:hypothetical protein
MPQFFNDGVGLSGGNSSIHVSFSEPALRLACEFLTSTTIRLYSQGELIYERFFPSSISRFAGLVSDTPFDAAIIFNAGGGEVNIDDLYFGPPFTGVVPVKPVTRVAYQGQTVTYNSNPITLGELHSPVTNNLGQVAFNGDTSVPGNSFIWFNDGVVFLNSDVTNATLTGAELQMGINDTGQFAFSPLHNGVDSIYTCQGLLFARGDAIPGLPGTFAEQVLTPLIVPNGRTYWWTNYSDVLGGPEVGRAILTCPNPAQPQSTQVAIKSGDIIDGYPITPDGIYMFDFSGDGSQWLQFVRIAAPGENFLRILRNGQTVVDNYQPGTRNWWGPFGDLCINNQGDFTFAAGLNNQEILVHNLDIVLQDGDVVDGVALETGVRANSINNIGKMAVEWNLAPAGAGVFYGDVDNMPNAACLLKIGDMIDYTGDGVADAGITWLDARTQDGPGITLSDHEFLFIEATLLDVGSNTQYEAILRLDVGPLGNCPANIVNSGASANGVDAEDLIAVILSWGPCPSPPVGCPANVANTGTSAGTVDVDDLIAVILGWGQCS